MILFTSSDADTTSIDRDSLAVGITVELIRLDHALEALDHKGFKHFQIVKQDAGHVKAGELYVTEGPCEHIRLKDFVSRYVMPQENEIRLPPNCLHLPNRSLNPPIAEGAHTHTQRHVLPAYDSHDAVPHYYSTEPLEDHRGHQ